MCHAICPFKVYNSVVFSMFRAVNPSPEPKFRASPPHPYTQRETLYPSAATPHSSPHPRNLLLYYIFPFRTLMQMKPHSLWSFVPGSLHLA